ncbi:thiol reductant ABC exporter subunit CydD [Virgibacillus profundi]|uniref:Thiol reductant ABC exporter subunit CydD n=1 Tax=Virgibacillus profundi TaxID=2024555 RepID=A0A2A2IB04_9BACI|nr:thiol reductant ABC exporter subunit CydD [Virgibacillus profundi]PAV28243.1 thiol reductant ABC exporter subunit CydD [Virgibacillus profundi]PXY52548.1 thiol reductant ABC exporter subunit CydD [Virgibacillus profundi]
MNNFKAAVSAQKKSFISLFIFAMLTGAMIIGQAYLLVAVIDGVFLKGQTFNEILPLLGGLLFVLFARVLFSYLSGRKGIRMGSKVKSDYRRALLNKYTQDPIQSSLRGQSGKKVSVIMEAVDEVDSYFSQYLPQVIQSAIIPLLILIVIFTSHANTGFIMLITTPFIPIFMIIIGMQTKKKSEEQLEKLGKFSGRFLDTLQGLVTLKLFGRARKQKDVIEESSLNFREATMEILKIAFTNSFMLELISMLSIGIIALEVALQLILFDGITFFTAFFVLILAPEFYTSLKELGNAFHNGRSSMGAVEKITEELKETDVTVEWGDSTLGTEKTPPEIIVQEVSFSYGENQFALENIHAEISPFSQLAIVGPSGSGKTTLMHVIAGLTAPSSGKMIINGNPLNHYQEEQWFNELSYISQHPYIFSGTIAENIAIGGGSEASQKEIEEAAEEAGIAGLIESLKQGYETPVGEAGRGLSGGERQRLALARAFLKRPSIILFDEPTTGLDLYTERILQASIKKLSQHATVITVAHRLHTIKNADQILFLEKGKVLGTGTHEQLINSVSKYREMVAVQQGGMAR